VLERTLSIIKPDATKRNLTETINKIIEDNELQIIAQKRLKLNIEQAKKFYAVHNDKPFFNNLVKYMSSEEIVVQVLEGDNAISKYRKIMGATDPQSAEEGTIRNQVAISKQENSVHGSDSIENAILEINFFFTKSEILS
tara:strand:+ start:195 stop:614 length:420 start_codon:yes stop_codon:yes gene_type:complete